MTDIAATLDALPQAGLHRERREIESAQGPTVTLGGREVILLCSNDYLGLAGDQRRARPERPEAGSRHIPQW